MGYEDELNPGVAEAQRREAERMASCFHSYKEVMRIDSEDGMCIAYLCTQCGDKRVVLEGKESTLSGEILP